MVLLGFFMLSVVVGGLLGVGWRVFDSWTEERDRKAFLAHEEAAEKALAVNREVMQRIQSITGPR